MAIAPIENHFYKEKNDIIVHHSINILKMEIGVQSELTKKKSVYENRQISH